MTPNPYRNPEFDGLSTRAKTVLGNLGFETKDQISDAVQDGGRLDGVNWRRWRHLGIFTYREILLWLEEKDETMEKRTVTCPKCKEVFGV